jgi:hypothetical protein
MYGGFEAEALQNFVHAFRLGAILLDLVSTLSKLFFSSLSAAKINYWPSQVVKYLWVKASDRIHFLPANIGGKDCQ